jgi:hypothetical protein
VFTVGEGPNETLSLHLGRSLVQTETIHQFLAQWMGATALSDRLRGDVSQVVERCESKHSAFKERSTAVSWSCFLVARLACEALLLAAVERAARQQPATSINRVLTWVKLRYEEALRRALVAATGEPQALTAPELTELIIAYEGSIGDIEQDLPGEEQALDPLLRRNPAIAPGTLLIVEPDKPPVSSSSSPILEASRPHLPPGPNGGLTRDQKRTLLRETLRSRIVRQHPAGGSLPAESAEAT